MGKEIKNCAKKLKEMKERHEATNNAMPDDLSEKGKLAWYEIMKTAEEQNLTYTGGCKTFYSPKEWKKRKEKYCLNSHLIVVYDGGDFQYLFNYSSESREAYMCLDNSLEKIDMYFENGTLWYSGIYNI